VSTITGTYHNALQHCRGTLIITCFSLWVWVISDCISNQLNWSSTLLPAHPLKSRQQRHWAPDTQSTLCGAVWSLCSTACSWTPCWDIYFTDLLLHGTALHCLRNTSITRSTKEILPGAARATLATDRQTDKACATASDHLSFVSATKGSGITVPWQLLRVRQP